MARAVRRRTRAVKIGNAYMASARCAGGAPRRAIASTPSLAPRRHAMLHMQHAQLAALLMEKTPSRRSSSPPQDREHRRQLERVRDSLLRRPDRRAPTARSADEELARRGARRASPAPPPPATRTPGATSSRRFDPMLRWIVRGYRLDAADAEDVVQTTWIRAYRNLTGSTSPPRSAAGWRSPPAARRCARCSAASASSPPPSPSPPRSPTPARPRTDADRAASAAPRVRAAVGRLPGRQRVLLTRHARRPARVLRRDLGERWRCRSARSARPGSARSAGCATTAPSQACWRREIVRP